MHKEELISKLERHVRHGSLEWQGQRPFALFFVEYLKNLTIKADEKYDFWDIRPHLPQIIVDAYEQLRTSKELMAVQWRRRFEQERGFTPPISLT